MFFSLPISVKNSHPLGYWLTPILVDALSKQTGEKGFFCYGKLGLRTPSSEEEGKYHRNLNFLNIVTERITDKSFVSDLYTFSLKACNSGRVASRVQESFVCPCGVLDIPIAIIEYAKEKTFKRFESVIFCKVCGQEARRLSVKNLFYTLKKETVFKSIGVFPNFYQKEVDEFVFQIHQHGIPISKTRSTGFVFDNWNLDIEFLWSLLPLVISNQTNNKAKLVVTNQVLRHAVVAYLLALELNPEFKADLVVSPVIVHPGKIEKWNLDRLRTLGYDGSMLRFILLCSLGWNQKDANLYDLLGAVEYRRFNLLKGSVGMTEEKFYSLQDAMRNMRQQNLVSGLSNVFNPERFDYKTLRGLF